MSSAQPAALSSLQARTDSIPKASLYDTGMTLADVILPTLAKGVIIRRPRVVSLAERLNLDARAIRRMQHIRNKYGPGPLLLRIPGRSIALILNPDDVHRVLYESPEPFTPASAEKRAALAHFEPKMALISQGPERAERRQYNEAVLDANRDVHHLADSFLRVVDAEASHLYDLVGQDGNLTWAEFSDVWFRIVRRIIFGDAARDDHELSEVVTKLRAAANWAVLRPQRKRLREQLFHRIHRYLELATPGSLARVMSTTPTTRETAPEQQVPQWLFAFDPAGMATFRSLALLTSHPDYTTRVRQEISSAAGYQKPYLRATVLESLRLWPTTPLVLRETTAETAWSTGRMPAHTNVVVFAPFFHRDNQTLPYADRFAPEVWMSGQVPPHQALIPFSEGPVVCPGRNLVLLLSTAMLTAILNRWRVRLLRPASLRTNPVMPATLSPYTLRFQVKH